MALKIFKIAIFFIIWTGLLVFIDDHTILDTKDKMAVFAAVVSVVGIFLA